jgi:hypothetical protein
VGEKAFFPVRGMDYDPQTGMLFTGDEMGYMNKWDVNKLIDKLEELKPKTVDDPNMSEKQKIA